MTPEPHVCCECNREIVYTDCLPAVCYRCRAREQEARIGKGLPRPDVVRDASRPHEGSL